MLVPEDIAAGPVRICVCALGYVAGPVRSSLRLWTGDRRFLGLASLWGSRIGPKRLLPLGCGRKVVANQNGGVPEVELLARAALGQRQRGGPFIDIVGDGCLFGPERGCNANIN